MLTGNEAEVLRRVEGCVVVWREAVVAWAGLTSVSVSEQLGACQDLLCDSLRVLAAGVKAASHAVKCGVGLCTV